MSDWHTKSKIVAMNPCIEKAAPSAERLVIQAVIDVFDTNKKIKAQLSYLGLQLANWLIYHRDEYELEDHTNEQVRYANFIQFFCKSHYYKSAPDHQEIDQLIPQLYQTFVGTSEPMLKRRILESAVFKG